MTDPTTPDPLSPSPEVTLIRRHGARWQISYDRDFEVWSAVLKPAATAENFVAALSAAELLGKLDAIEAGQ
jgi:hypothetical protein